MTKETLASLAAERLGWSDSEKLALIRAALTMNIAMLDLQNTLATQTTPLTPAQRADIDSHPQRGRAMLEAAQVTCQDWLRTVEQHHVTVDGRDIPKDRTDISPLACMVHYTDVYLARISPRATRAAQAVNVAARDLFMKAGGADNPYAAAIIKDGGHLSTRQLREAGQWRHGRGRAQRRNGGHPTGAQSDQCRWLGLSRLEAARHGQARVQGHRFGSARQCDADLEPRQAVRLRHRLNASRAAFPDGCQRQGDDFAISRYHGACNTLSTGG